MLIYCSETRVNEWKVCLRNALRFGVAYDECRSLVKLGFDFFVLML